MMGDVLPRARGWRKLGLWPHQVEAVETVRAYQRSRSSGSALIRMPTGSGKTGVMAVLAQCFKDTPDVLVIVPWAQLRSQSVEEIDRQFWVKLGAQPRSGLKPVCAFKPSTASQVLDESEGVPTVFVCTYQTLERLWAAEDDSYIRLADRLQLVVVDEGHREPAKKWAQCVRELGQPTVLLTATPYRNDQRWFRVDSDYVYRLSHQDALASRCIRKVRFDEASFGDSAESFVKELIDYYEDSFLPRRPPGRRVIVRCGTDDQIRQVVTLLTSRGYSAVGVHDQFKRDPDPSLKRTVPSPARTEATFWVHQNKLMEGLDDSSFALLAILAPFQDARALVQQVGRVLRNPTRKHRQHAAVFCHIEHSQSEVWSEYLAYESALTGGAVDVGPVARFVQDVLELQDEYQYLDGAFRSRFDPESSTAYESIGYHCAASVFEPRPGFSMDDLEWSVRDYLDDQDSHVLAEHAPEPLTHIFLYARCHSAPILSDQAFMELRLGYCLMRRSSGYVFYYDSCSGTAPYLLNMADRVSPDGLEKLLAGDDVRVSQVSLINCDLGLYSVRRRGLSARSIGELAPGLADHMQFCSTASGVVELEPSRAVRRYVGFTRGRVSEPSARRVGYSRYVEWIDSVAQALDGSSKGPPVFDRYASHSAVPRDAVPEHILFDLEDVEADFSFLRQGSALVAETLVMDDKCWDVTESEDGRYVFSPEVNGALCEAALTYDTERGRFEVDSQALKSHVVHSVPSQERQVNIVSYLNREQAFRIVTKGGLIYAHGRFYKPRVPLWGRKRSDRIDLLSIIKPLDHMTTIETEKGAQGSATGEGWCPSSLFAFIDDRGETGLLAQVGTDVDVLICEDLGTELADFIAVRFDPPLVAMIHAKCSNKGGGLSASAFHDVCGQAVKNLDFMIPQRPYRDGLAEKWRAVWDDGRAGPAGKRVRYCPTGMTPSSLARDVQRLVRHPAAQREVWLAMGNGLSLAEFEKQRRRQKPKPSTIQLLYLLQSTWSSVSSVGANLRVFCRP